MILSSQSLSMVSSMSYLYEEIDAAKKYGVKADIPSFLEDNLSPNIRLRDYQKEAIQNTLIYLNNKDLSKNKQIHILYHMATGSGKTVIMAMNILYYYQLGYRNFLFFTNQTNIVSKTRINFLEKNSSKYLFADSIFINGKTIRIKEVENFENSDRDAINICFNTVQGIHSSLSLIKEGSLSIEDFENEKIVLIADEAHHLNSTTAKDKDAKKDNATWEDTVNRIFYANKDNVLLEYTATCDIKDPNVNAKYLDKIIFNFDLSEFREAGYTKEFFNLKSNSSKWIKTLQAIILSEYRKLLFQNHNISIQPVVLLKSKTIADSKAFYKEFYEKIKYLNSADLDMIKNNNLGNKVFTNAYSFFDLIGITDEKLVDLIKMDFSIENSVNMNELTSENESIVNNLDEKNNKYRLIFTVDKLTEGWDVLSLFDIVRLYETRQGGSKGAVSNYTIREAQLIGRGARYCPFKFEENQNKEKRKYSNYDNPLSICETLLYHCMDDLKYIDEIKKALKATGLLPTLEPKEINYKLKNSFKSTQIYLEGYVFLNKRVEVGRESVTSLPEKIRMQGIGYKCYNGATSIQNLMDDKDNNSDLKYKSLEPISFKNIEKNISKKAYRQFYSTLSFDKLKEKFPNLKSVDEFLNSNLYLGDFPITFWVLKNEKPTNEDKLEACKRVLQIVSDYIQKIEITYRGTTEFYCNYVHDVFSDKTRYVLRDKDDESWGMGVSQGSELVNETYRMDLSDKDWYAYNDNFGTSEEKKFVSYFSSIVGNLKQIFNQVYLIRNEIQTCIYSFDDGSKFEPDYVLILKKTLEEQKNNKDNIYICMFVEPKGEHLLQKDAWKNTLLLQLKEKSIPVIKFADDNEYRIWGSPLYNESSTKADFIEYFNSLLSTV